MPFLYPCLRKTTIAVLLLGTVLSPVYSYADPLDDHLSARAEVSVKGGSDRSVLTTEFWAPLAQQSGRVVYTDLRLMGDDDDNREGNLGLGYRQVTDWSDSVLGGHVWIDRRRTEHNATFHQVTVGVESLGKVIDLRANGYIALNDAKVTTTPATGPLGPYLLGSGLFYNTNSSITETPQHGIDAEAGYRLPILQRYTDTIRVYGGGYHFFRENTDSTTGYRIRTEAVINPVLSLGARFQHDGERGSQTFLEATLRFPFSAKKLYQQKGLYARLDESPERDVDIVTGTKVDNGQRQILNNAGTNQRILYVDNSTTNGDGTIEHPFNNLTSAQAALQANDILYVKAGTGTTQGMDTGITISQPNISLIGSGSPLTIQGITFIGAGAAPVITNTNAYIDDLVNNVHTGNGVFITGDNALITGITVNGAQGSGIYALANGRIFNNILVNNTTTLNNINGGGIFIDARNGGRINNVGISDNIANNNGNVALNDAGGIFVQSRDANSYVDNIVMARNSASFNRNDGIRAGGRSGGTINNVTIDNSFTSSNNPGNGIDIHIDGGTVNTATITNAIVNNNYYSGVSSYVRNGGVLGTINIQNISATGSTTGVGVIVSADTFNGRVGTINASNIVANSNNQGVRFTSSAAAGQINQINATNITANGNTGQGVLAGASNGGVINNVDLSFITVSNAVANHGLQVIAQNGGIIGNANLSNISSFNNSNQGIVLQATGANAILGTANISNSLSINNRQSGVYVTADNGGVINQTSVSSITANNNTQTGISAITSANSHIGTVSITNSTATNNGTIGIVSSATVNSQISNLTINNNISNGNGSNGINAQATGIGSSIGSIITNGNTTNNNRNTGLNVLVSTGAVVANTAVTNNSSNNNTGSNGYGIALTTGGATAAVTNSVVSGNTATGNAQAGFYLYADTTSSLSTSFYNNNSTGNVTNGVNVVKFTSAGFVVDMGGGSLGSIGYNRIFNNTGTEVRANAYALVARSNYWGGGDLVAGEKTLVSGGTVDSTGFLTVDPRP